MILAQISAWFRLVRWSNLTIILLTQIVVWALVVYPLGATHTLVLAPLHFAALATSWVMLAAAGYVINDYFDLRIDKINKPHKMILDKAIAPRKAILMHGFLNFFAILLAAWVARSAGRPEWLVVQVGTGILLWFYSTYFKRQFAIGNLVVAVLTAFTILTLYIYEPATRGNATLPNSPIRVQPLLLAFAGFAFLSTWIREVVKDMEDIIGDLQEQCDTMPIRLGLKKTGYFVQSLSLCLVVLLILLIANILKVELWLSAMVTVLFVLSPLLLFIGKLQTATNAAHYHKMSRLLKLMMLGGIALLASISLNFNF